MAITTQERTNILKLTVGLFNAAPGANYMSEFTSVFEANGHNLAALAGTLGTTGAFQSLYPNFQTASEFATKFLTTLGLQGNTEAVDFVTAKFNAGVPKAQIIYDAVVALDASTSAEFAAAKAILVNKAAVAENYSVTLGASSTSLEALQGALANVTADPASVTAANAANAGGNGQTFTLTTNIDNIAGTSGNDTIIGDFGVTGQVSAADQINGGAGTDTLELYGAFGTLPMNITGVEKLNLSGYGDQKTINVSTLTGVTDLVLRNQTTQGTSAGSGDSTVTIAAGQTVTLNTVQDSTNVANELIIASASSVTANTLILDKAGDAATSGNDLEIEIAGTGVKTLNLQTANNASRISLQDETATGDFAVDTINITGDKNLTVDALAASSATKVTIAAGSFTGALNLNLSATENFEVTGGTGNDRFKFGGAFDASDKVAGGNGTDTVAVSTLTGVATWLNGKTSGVANHSSIEVLEYTGNTAIALDAAAITLSGLTSYKTSDVIAATAASGASGGTVSLDVTNQSNAQTFVIAGNVTGGTGGAGAASGDAGGAAGAAVKFAPAVNNGANAINIELVGVTITGGTGGAAGGSTSGSSGGGTGGAGGTAADFSNFETINITSSGATATAVNTFTGGTGGASGASGGGADGATGATLVVSANATINISGANEINLGTISNSNQPVTINAANLTGKLTVGTGTAADVITGGSNINTITLNGGADQVDLAKSVAKADVITVAAATNTTTSAFAKIAGFTNVATNGDKLDLGLTLAIVNDAAAGTVAGTGLTASVSNGILTFAGANAATATLADKVAGVVKAGLADAANEVVAFEHGGNTYIVANAGADNTFDAGTDYLVELTGVTGLTALSLTASAANTAWVL